VRLVWEEMRITVERESNETKTWLSLRAEMGMENGMEGGG